MRTKQEDLPGETSSFHVTRYWGENCWTITEHKNSAADVVGRARRTGTLLVGMPLVTIAMVVRNAVEAFTDTFRSIEQQTYPNIEIIVIDGGSTDGTLELIRERESRIARWISEPDKGPYDGMNKAARLANGRWILFMNAGDFFYTPEAIEIALNGAPEKADFIIGHHIYRSIEGVDELHKASDFEDTWGTLTAGRLSFRWLSGVPCHQATFTRTSMLREGEYDYQKYPIAADHEFMYRMRSKGASFYHCDEIIAVYLSGGHSWLSQKDTVTDWWHIARRYGPREDVDRFFLSYPAAMPLVTIAIVVRNAVEAFTDTFRSIEQQTYPNIEIIVIDGGSTDGTLELIREREDRIARWISEPDKGPYDGMNKAARLANGRWILFMNAGDFFYTPEAVEIALNGAPEKADFIIGHHIYRSIEGVDELHKASDFEDTWGTLTAGQLSFRWLSGVPCHQATFTRTSMLREGEYDYQKYSIAADHEFMYRMRSKGASFYHCDEIIAVYLAGGHSWLSHKDTVTDWWHIARRYGPREDVDRFFRVSYPAAFASDHWLAVALRALRHKYFGCARLPAKHRLTLVTKQGRFFDFGRRVARRAFPKKRPAWSSSVAVIFMTVDGLIMKFDRSKSVSAPNRYRGMQGRESSDDRSAVPPDKVKVPSRVE